MDRNVWIVLSAVLFGLFVVFRFRPAMGLTPAHREERARLREAKARVQKATTDEERANALCDAGDACAAGGARRGAAFGFYLRALKLRPSEASFVARAAHGLARRPRALESLLWRHLASTEWKGEARPAVQASLQELSTLYATRLGRGARARALAHALEATGGKHVPPPSSSAMMEAAEPRD